MQEHKKKVFFFLSPFCGGAERMTITISKLLDMEKYDVRYVVVGTHLGEVVELLPKGSNAELIHIRNIYDFTTCKIYRYLKKEKPHYVFCSLVYLNARIITAATRFSEIKIIVRCNCAVSRLTGITKYLSMMAYPKADIVIAQTEQMKKELEVLLHLSSDKVIAMHNMIDKELILKKTKDAISPYPQDENKHFLWVGRFVKIKGADVVVKAFVEAKKIQNNISLFMAGKFDESDEYFKSVKQIAIENGVLDSVHFVGFQSNPYQWMKYADCFLLSSRSEASPNALFEALYLGVPSVATYCTPNLDEIISNDVNGYKVENEDYLDFGQKMIDALQVKEASLIYNTSTPEEFRNLFN